MKLSNGAMGWFYSKKKVNRLKREKENLIQEIESLGRKIEDLSRDAMMHSKNILRKKRRGEDPEQELKRLKGSTDKPTFEKHFEVLHRNLNELEATTNKIKKENLNLNEDLTAKNAEIIKLTEQLQQSDNGMQKVTIDLKQKERECVHFQKTCISALEQLSPHQSGGFNLIEREPQTYALAFNDGIKKLLDEADKYKKENNNLLQYKVEQENKIENLQTQIRSLEQINDKFQNEKQQLQATLDEAHLEAQYEINNLKTTAYSKQEQCDTSEEVLCLLSKINKYEELLKTGDISAINTKVQEFNKCLGKFYGKEIHRLNMEILKLLGLLKDEQINEQHEVFKRVMNLKTEALEKELKHSYLLNPEDLKKKFKHQLSENVRSIEEQLKIFQQIIFDFPAIEAQRRKAYEDVVSTLTDEYIHLQSLFSTKLGPKSLVSFDLPANDVGLKNSYVRETLERLAKINKSTEELEERVNKFRGCKTDKIFLDLEYKLLGNIMNVDTIQVNGYEVIREKRREAIKYAQECMDKLNNKS